MPVQTRSKRGTVHLTRSREDIFTKTVRNVFSAIFNVWQSYCESDCQLKPAQLIRLSEHKYMGVDTSWLDDFCMKDFWNSVVEMYPMWLAPNLITLVGLIINLVTVLILSHFCFSATEVAPWWAYLQAAVGLFIYQTLDATDGKQARRTNSASPLGELFDHGCDSMTQVFVTMNICYSMQMGNERYLVLFVAICSMTIFYCAHWSTYCTGQLRFSRFDVTEAQMTVIGVLLMTAFFGPGIWSVSVLGFKLRSLMITVAFFLLIWQLCGYLKIILSEGVGRNGSTVAGTSVLFPLFPLLTVCVPFVMIYSKSTSGIYDQKITLLCLCFGAVAAKATNRVVIAYMSRHELELCDWIYLSPFMMFLNQYYDFLVDEYKLLLFATQFCDHLQIYCFSLEKPPPPATATSSGITNGASTRQTAKTK